MAAGDADADSAKLGVTTVFSNMMSLAFSKRGLRFFPGVIGVYLVVYVIGAVAFVVSVYAAVGTLSFHRIVNTNCFVKQGTSENFYIGTGGVGPSSQTNYLIRPHCDAFPLPIDWGALVLSVVASIIVLTLVSTAALIFIARFTDRFSTQSGRRLMPTVPEAGRALGRSIGWVLVIYIAGAVIVGVFAGVFALSASLFPTVVTALIAIAAFGGFVFAFIRYLIPWYIRAQFTMLIVFADDARCAESGGRR